MKGVGKESKLIRGVLQDFGHRKLVPVGEKNK